jgi:hypothetical protein
MCKAVKTQPLRNPSNTTMPTLSFSGALLALASTDSDGAWEWPHWQTVTDLEVAPYSIRALEHLDKMPPDWTATTVTSIRAFAVKFWSLPEARRINFIKENSDQDQEGRAAWTTFVAKRLGKWGVFEKVTETLLEYRCHPYAVMKRLEARDVRLHSVCRGLADSPVDAVYQPSTVID